MSTKGWLILGVVVVVVVIAAGVVVGIGYVATRATEVSRSIETARDRYAEVNRDFPFTVPAAGEVTADRFERYLKVRSALHTVMAPLKSTGGLMEGLSVLTSLPGEVSRAQVDALRENSMSMNEYRWISRQLYTTVAAEQSRPDADKSIAELRRNLASGRGQRGGFVIETNADDKDVFDMGMLDFRWLRVPDTTRELVRKHAPQIAETSSASMAETFLLNVDFER